MYPTLSIRWLSLSMTWIWIVIFLIVFILIAKKKAHVQWLQFRALLRYLPFIILLAYLLWSRSWYFWSDHTIISFSWRQRLLYLSPYEYHFHFTWIALWATIWRWKFLKTQRWEVHHLWWSILFESLCIATIPLWIFFLLGDHFIWKPVDSGWFVSAIDPESNVATFDTVIPLWLYLWAWAWLLYILIVFLHTRNPQLRRTFIWLITYVLWRWILLLRQIYPRHAVIKLWTTTVDVKQYMCILIALLIARQRYRISSSKTNL